MNLYLLKQEENKTYDSYDSCVVCAATEEDAKTINPDDSGITFTPTEKFPYWARTFEGVMCKYIGVAAEGMKRGVIVASYNAG